jgi:WhiB family redox-sensing transcriptional regulator
MDMRAFACNSTHTTVPISVYGYETFIKERIMTHVITHTAPLQPHTGLCQYDDPELWFQQNRDTRAAAICANCPVIAGCAQAALDLDVTDGIWAGVGLPGANATVRHLGEARKRLREVVERNRHQPPAQRRRALVLREAIHDAAARQHARELIAQAIGYATQEQATALRSLRAAIDEHRQQPPPERRPAMIIRQATHYAATREHASA